MSKKSTNGTPAGGAVPTVHLDDKKDGATEEIWVNKFDEMAAAGFRASLLKSVMMDPTAPVVIWIDSFGGQVDSLAKMIDTMDEVTNRYGTTLITVCCGKAMSCGAILLSHGDIRYCAPNSRTMVHEVSSVTYGDVNDIANDAQELKRLNTHFLGLLASNCDIAGGFKGLRKIIKDHDGKELWLDAAASLEFGLVDYIGVPKITKITQYAAMSSESEPKSQRRKRFQKAVKVGKKKK